MVGREDEFPLLFRVPVDHPPEEPVVVARSLLAPGALGAARCPLSCRVQDAFKEHAQNGAAPAAQAQLCSGLFGVAERSLCASRSF